MIDVALFLQENNLRVEQVQEFTPTPGSLATCIYYTGRDPFSGDVIHVARNSIERRQQKSLLLWHLPESRKDVTEALRQCGREELIDRLTTDHELSMDKSSRPTARLKKRTRKR